MKQQYSTDDLAKIVKSAIERQYDNPQKILNDLNTNIKRKVKSLQNKEMTDNEIATRSLHIANDLFKDLNRIPLAFISAKLSNELITHARNQGIELEEYKTYFLNFSKEMLKQLLEAKFNSLNAKLKKANSTSKNKPSNKR